MANQKAVVKPSLRFGTQGRGPLWAFLVKQRVSGSLRPYLPAAYSLSGFSRANQNFRPSKMNAAREFEAEC